MSQALKKVSMGSDRCLWKKMFPKFFLFTRKIEWTSILPNLFWKHHETLRAMWGNDLGGITRWRWPIRCYDEIVGRTSLEYSKPTKLPGTLNCPKQPFQLDDCKSLHRKWLEITKHPAKNGCLGSPLSLWFSAAVVPTAVPPGFLDVVRNCIMLQRCLVQAKWKIEWTAQKLVVNNPKALLLVG